MRDHFQISDQLETSVGRGGSFHEALPVRGHVHIELYGPDGELKESRDVDNLVVDAGEAHIADRLSTSAHRCGDGLDGDRHRRHRPRVRQHRPGCGDRPQRPHLSHRLGQRCHLCRQLGGR